MFRVPTIALNPLRCFILLRFERKLLELDLLRNLTRKCEKHKLLLRRRQSAEDLLLTLDCTLLISRLIGLRKSLTTGY